MGKELSTQDTLNSYELSNNKSNVYLWLHQVIDGVKSTKFATFENLVNAVYSLLSDAFTPDTPETAIVGEGKIWFGLTAPSKWLLVNGDTIGNLSSGADHAAEGYEDLFFFLWENHADTSCPVSGGRGLTADADFAAGKTITLPNACGRVLLGAGQGSGLTNRALGDVLGEEEHTDTVDEMPAHQHGVMSNGSSSGSLYWLTNSYKAIETAWKNTTSTGGGEAHNNMQPSLVVNFILYAGV